MMIGHKYEANTECFYENVLCYWVQRQFLQLLKEILQSMWNFYFVEVKLQM